MGVDWIGKEVIIAESGAVLVRIIVISQEVNIAGNN
jgi:hypothetical protein